MTNKYTWEVDSLDVEQTPNPNTVVNVHWRLWVDDGNGHTVSSYGEVPAGPLSASFTPYAQLTLQMVTGWATAALGGDQVNAIKAALDARLAEIATPVMISPPLPWLAL